MERSKGVKGREVRVILVAIHTIILVGHPYIPLHFWIMLYKRFVCFFFAVPQCHTGGCRSVSASTPLVCICDSVFVEEGLGQNVSGLTKAYNILTA